MASNYKLEMISLWDVKEKCIIEKVRKANTEMQTSPHPKKNSRKYNLLLRSPDSSIVDQ